MKMKFTKKIATILLSVCLIVPCFSVMALAANGVIFFSDLETSVGDEFTITGTAVVSGDVIGDATIHMTYDPSYMRFEEGDGVNADTDGNLTFKGSGDGSSDRIEFTMKFQALRKEVQDLNREMRRLQTALDQVWHVKKDMRMLRSEQEIRARSRMLRVEQVSRLMVRSIPYPVISQTA